jgi:hypothetical protein
MALFHAFRKGPFALAPGQLRAGRGFDTNGLFGFFHNRRAVFFFK